MSCDVAVSMLRSVFKHVTVQTLVQADRLVVYEILQYFLEKRLEGMFLTKSKTAERMNSSRNHFISYIFWYFCTLFEDVLQQQCYFSTGMKQVVGIHMKRYYVAVLVVFQKYGGACSKIFEYS